MTKYTIKKEKDFVQIPNSILTNPDISLKAKGILALMLSLPDNWEFSENGLIQIFKQDGQASIRTGLKHLEECGYLTRKRTRNSAGQLTNVEWTVYDYPHLENPNLDNPQLDNQPQYNTKESITNESITKEKKKGSKSTSVTFDSIIDGYTEDIDLRATLIEFLKMRQRIKKPMTNYALELLLKKLDKLADSTHVKIAILNQSIINGWQDIYALKEGGRGNAKHVGSNTGANEEIERGIGWNRVL